MELKYLIGSGALLHDMAVFPVTDVSVSFSQPSFDEVRHTLSNGIAYMSFSNNYFMGNFRDSIETYANYINKLKNDPAVRGLIFSQYSGGGSGIAAELLRQTFEDFKKTKPVIIYAHAIGSAAYLSSLGANLIIASSKMSHIGSIGAVVNIDRMQAYYESVMIQSIYAKQSTEKGDPHRSYLKNPEDISKYEESATKMAQVFIDLVVEKRKNVAKSALKGAYYPADEAKALGLIDGIGSMEYVEQRMQKQLEFYKKTG